MSHVCIADALRATQIELSYQQMFYYCWNHCSVCSISMLEYAGKTNTKHSAYHMFITKVIIQGPTLFDLYLSFYFSDLFSKIHTNMKQKQNSTLCLRFFTPFLHAQGLRSLKVLIKIYTLLAETFNSKASFQLETFQVQNLTNFLNQKTQAQA